MKILRVFPHQTSFTPIDELATIGNPPMPAFIPEHDEVHISCTFSWDKQACEELKYQWEVATQKEVKLGGVAYGDKAEDFVQGRYLKPNIILTTRGCNNNCPWCIVPKIEGNMRELPVCCGNVIQDNNFLQASKKHKDKVFSMLRTQRAIMFKGGLEAHLIDDHFIDNITSLRIAELWLACDTDGALRTFKKAVEKLKKAGFTRDKIHSYVLIGDDMQKNDARLREVYEVGAMPFAQLFMELGANKKTEYSKEWRDFQRVWSRPAIIRARMANETEDKQ